MMMAERSHLHVRSPEVGVISLAHKVGRMSVPDNHNDVAILTGTIGCDDRGTRVACPSGCVRLHRIPLTTDADTKCRQTGD